MKRKVIFITFVASSLLFSGCSSSSTEDQSLESAKPTKTALVTETLALQPTATASIEPTVKPTVEPTEAPVDTKDAKTVLKEYADAFIAKRFDDLTSLIYPDNFNITADELVQRIKENDFKTNVEYSGYKITSITDYDETHKLAKLLVKPSNGSTALEDSVGLVRSGNEWKVDLSLIVKSERSNEAIMIKNKALTITKINKVTKLNGYEFTIEYKNNLKDNRILVSWMNNSSAVLNTDKGQVTEQLGKASVGPQETGTIIINFMIPEKASAQSITIKGFREAYLNNLPIPGKEAFEFLISL